MKLNKDNKTIWLTWHISARSRNLSKVLNIPIYEYFENRSIFTRHLFSSIWTIYFLIKNKPKVVIIHYSFLLLVVLGLYKKVIFNHMVIIADVHTKGLRRSVKGILSKLFWHIKKTSFIAVDLAIITNTGMIKDIEILNKNYLILPDKIPENVDVEISDEKEKYCVNISSFAIDEPYEEIFEVAKLLDDEIKLFWTGKKPDHYKLPDKLPSNIIFTGYVSFDDYYNLIGNANCILALTTEEDCLQSGAYEALSVGVPMVISDTNALQEYFSDAAIYTSHKPIDIANNIKKAIKNSEDQKVNIESIKEIRNNEFNTQIKSLKEFINNRK